MVFKLIMPADEKLVAAVRQLAERVAQCAGYPATEAQRIGSSVGGALQSVLTRHAAYAPGEPMDIRFVREGAYLDVWLRYRAEQCDRPAVDPALSAEALRQGMDSAEFGREGEITYCRLRRTLPSEKVDHQCEVPPDAK